MIGTPAPTSSSVRERLAPRATATGADSPARAMATDRVPLAELEIARQLVEYVAVPGPLGIDAKLAEAAGCRVHGSPIDQRSVPGLVRVVADGHAAVAAASMTAREARLLEDVGGDPLPGRRRRAAVRACLGMDAEEGQRDTRRVSDDPSCRTFHGAPPAHRPGPQPEQ